MISQKARLSEAPLVRKSDNYLIGIISFVNNHPLTNKLLLFVFMYLLVAATTSSTSMGCVNTHYIFERNVSDVIPSLKWMKNTHNN